MTQEEKAKAYDEVVNKLRRFMAQGVEPLITRADIQDFFPELKVSEDERIRKELIDAIHGLWDNDALPMPLSAKRKDTWLTWLEKQGKQEQTSEFNAVDWQPSKVDGKIHNIYNVGVEPKFKNGQWIVWQDKCYKVNYNGCGYELIDQNGLSTSLEYGTVDENAHLWTIADVKDGDILVDRFSTNSIIVLFKGINLKSSILVYCGYNGYSFSVKTDGLGYGRVDNTNYHPATKEQRELLFQKMKEAGYEWDSKKKKLRKVEKDSKKKEKWSDDDEQYLLICKNALRKYQVSDKWDADIISKWLEDKLKQGEPKSKWTEEDEKCIDNCCLLIGAADDCYEKTFKDDCIHYLQSLKERISWKPMPIKQKDIDDLVFDFKWSSENFKNKKVTDIYRQGIYDVMELLKQRMEEQQ